MSAMLAEGSRLRCGAALALVALSIVPALLGLFAPGDLEPPPMMLIAIALVLVARGVSGLRPDPIWRWSAIAGFSLTAIAGAIAIATADEGGNLPSGAIEVFVTALTWVAQAVIVGVLAGTVLYARDLFRLTRSAPRPQTV